MEAPEHLWPSEIVSVFASQLDDTHIAEKGLLGDSTVTVAE